MINRVAEVDPAMVVRSGPIDMLLRLSEMLSRKETFLTSPVLSLTKTVWAFCSVAWESPIGRGKNSSVFMGGFA